MSGAVIFNIQRFSIHDGPGIRTTVFLKGCPLRCEWCHNPEGIRPEPELMLAARHCIGCEECEGVCAQGGARRLDGGLHHPGGLCTTCGACAAVCPGGAREIVGRRWEVDELLAELRRDNGFYDTTGGGVTFSGGEPLAPASAPFVLECLDSLTASGVPTAVDTCGHVRTETLLAAAARTDLVLYDLKIMDPARHRDATGRDNALILHNLALLLELGRPVRVRVPLIPGRTADPANLAAIGDFLATRSGAPPVQLLPYHAIGRDKFARLGRANPLPKAPVLAAADVAAGAELLRGRGLSVTAGG